MPTARRTVVLREYDEREVELSPSAAQELDQLSGKRLAVGIGSRPGVWKLTATSFVGTLVTADLEVLVRPKIPLENLFLLLDVDLPPVAWGALPFGYEAAEENLLAAFAALYARSLERALGNGLLHSYQTRTDRLVALRGRVKVNEVFCLPGTPIPVPCTFDEYTADNLENRYLRAAIERLMQVAGVDLTTRQTLRRHLMLFEGVTSLPVRPEVFNEIIFNRLNFHYQPALRLARLVLENLGLADNAGDRPASSFMLDMNLLFENWVTDRIRHQLRGSLTVDAQASMYLDRDSRVLMRPDLVFRRNGEVVHVADVKYKTTGTGGVGRSEDHYQLLAYATALGLDDGLLIYGNASGQRTDHQAIVRHAGTRLHTHALDLRGNAQAIESDIAALAEIIERGSASVPSGISASKRPAGSQFRGDDHEERGFLRFRTMPATARARSTM